MDDLYIKYMDETYGLSGGGSSISITPSLSSGTKVADYEIDGISGELYAPTPTEIEANPSDTATTDLEKIDIGGVVYGIPTGVDDIADLSDVDISSPTDGQILKYNTTTSKWENASESGGTTVIANPSGTATDDLEKIQVDNSIYAIPTPIDVEANPSASGTADLEKLKVGAVVYDIPAPTEVIPNPSTTATADLEKIQIGNDVYGIPEGTVVEANPSGTATTDLTAIQIDNDIYSIPSGGTTVIPNPTGTAVADLNSVQIGNDIYSIPSGGGGGGYTETELYITNTPDLSANAIFNLNDDIENYDTFVFKIQTSYQPIYLQVPTSEILTGEQFCVYANIGMNQYQTLYKTASNQLTAPASGSFNWGILKIIGIKY